MDTHDPEEYLPVESAGNVAGIPPRTLRSWITAGKLPATEGPRGKLVRLGDVLAIAEATGRRPAHDRQPVGNAGMPAGFAGEAAGDVADVGAVAVSPTARAQLEAIRDEWLRPLTDRVEALARENGRLQAERDALRAELDRVRAEHEAAVARSDAPGAMETPATGQGARGALRWLWARLIGQE